MHILCIIEGTQHNSAVAAALHIECRCLCVCAPLLYCSLTHKGCHMLAYLCTSKGGIRIESSRGEFSFRIVSFSFSFAFLFFLLSGFFVIVIEVVAVAVACVSHFPCPFPSAAVVAAVCHEPLPSPFSPGSVIMFHPSSCCCCCSCKSGKVLGVELGLRPGRARIA